MNLRSNLVSFSIVGLVKSTVDGKHIQKEKTHTAVLNFIGDTKCFFLLRSLLRVLYS